MGERGYCDNSECELSGKTDAPGPIEVIKENKIVRISRHQVQTQAGGTFNLCSICYGAVRLFCVDKKTD